MTCTVTEFLRSVERRLPNSETPRLDAMVLLEYVTGIDRADLLAELRSPLSTVLPPTAREQLDDLVARRSSGIPIAYLTGTREFYGRSFAVGPGVLIPRPESEHLVERALDILAPRDEARVHDCCTGSGCIGISIAAERSAVGQRTHLVLSDRSTAALEWARHNAEMLLEPDTVAVTISAADLLSGSSGADPVDLITANPPYLTTAQTRAALERGWGEPPEALDGGPDGLSPYPDLVSQALRSLARPGHLLVEHGNDQGEAVVALLRDAGFDDATIHRDLAHHDRFVHGIRHADTGTQKR